MDFRKYEKKFNNKEYVFGRGSETEYYIVIVKIEEKNYMLTLLKNHSKIYQSYHQGLTLTKFHAFEWLIKHDSLIFKNNQVTMVHYKEDRPNGKPWVKDTNIELIKNLEQYFLQRTTTSQGGNINEFIIPEGSMEYKIEEILLLTEKEIEVTEREQIIKTRIGQIIFKKTLVIKHNKCNLCGVADERFLVASHIKPWSKSNNQERLDVNNGMLLCPNHDSLFDKGYISFNDNGIIIITNSLDETTKQFLNIHENMFVRFNEYQKGYLKWHRENILKY